MYLLGEVAAGIIPLSRYGLNRVLGAGAHATPSPQCMEVSCCRDEVESKLKTTRDGMNND